MATSEWALKGGWARARGDGQAKEIPVTMQYAGTKKAKAKTYTPTFNAETGEWAEVEDNDYGGKPSKWELGLDEQRSCSHRGHAVRDVPTLLGSSARDGLVIPGNSVTVLLTSEALPRAFPHGWATYHSAAFNNHLHGALVYWPWKDMGAPPLDDQTISRVRELHDQHVSGKTIEVACYGGHGRTGTLLAILAALRLEWPADQAVKMLRARYCNKAIESEEQERFVEAVIGRIRG